MTGRMTGAQRRYLGTETAVSAAINAALSVAFVFLVFGGRSVVSAMGAGGLEVDALPQSFAVALMATLVPTLLTRKRVRAGAVAPLAASDNRPPPGPRNAVGRALLVAAAVTVAAYLLHRLLLPLGPPEWPFAAVLAFKAGYGALLGAGVSAVAVRAALRDR